VETCSYREQHNADQALQRRKYELHSRLRFNHRGQVAMAMTVDDNDDDAVLLQPQFFITLEENANLNNKHVLFGTVMGPTLFNAIRINQIHVSEGNDSNSSLNLLLSTAPRITNVTIVDAYFTDLTASAIVPWRQQQKVELPKKRKRKGVSNIHVLSFGDEIENDQVVDAPKKISSENNKLAASKSESPVVNNVGDSSKDKTPGPVEPSIAATEKDPPIKDAPVTSLHQFSKAADRKQSKEVNISLAPAAHKVEAKSVRKKVSIVEQRNAKYRMGKKGATQRENDTMEKLMSFKQKVKTRATNDATLLSQNQDNSLATRMARKAQQQEVHELIDSAPAYHGQLLEGNNNDETCDWLQTRFKCRQHVDDHARKSGSDGRSMDDYQVVDDAREARH
jgi:cyclophilin family peptidyl-prolyl cis-trans isomerase